MAGWLRRQAQGNCLGLGLVVASQLVDAAPKDVAPPPDGDFLEFLGTWETGDGKWIDPFQVEDASVLGTSDGSGESREREFRDRPRKKRFEQDDSLSKDTDSPSQRKKVEQ
ncbi:MAG: hypothetical protein ACT4OO_08690 [Nitrospiraceae bacterium]